MRWNLAANVAVTAGVVMAASPVLVPSAAAASGFATYDAIVALDNCSGSVVRFPGAADTDKAIVMSNGHCLPTMPSPNTFQVDKAANRTAKVLGGSDAHTVVTLTLDRLLYATMTGTDVSLYRSTMTYGLLKSTYKVTARPMATTHPVDGTAIDVPSGYWKQHYSCAIDGFVRRLDEGGYEMKDSIRYSTCQTPHGSSGSPVIDAATGTVIGINNTGNDDGEECTLNNPCEIDEAGNVHVEKGQSYAQETYQINSCITGSSIDLTKAGCALYGATSPSPSDPKPTPGTNVIVNGGFENGTTGWSGTTGAITTSTEKPARTGTAKAWLGGNGRTAKETLKQTFTVPSGATKAAVTYWVRVDTDETGRTVFDTFTAQASDGTRTSSAPTLSNVDATGTYVQKSIDVSAMAGKSVTLMFTATEDEAVQTSFVVDDVALATS